jgi:SAM-dependent methyltransferase
VSRHTRGARFLRRGWNGLRKLSSGLRLFGENISPEIPNDLYQAHLSIYFFFSRLVRGRRLLDLGCGCGYGAPHLMAGGVDTVVGVDLDPRNIRYATRHFGGPRVTFRRADAERPPEDLGVFGAIVSSNLFEHLIDVDAALSGVVCLLAPGGTFLLAVPPIVDEWSRQEHERIPYHRSNFSIGEWRERLHRRFSKLCAFRHLEPENQRPDFSDPFPSRLGPEDFRFVEVAAERLGDEPTMTAIFVAEDPVLVPSRETSGPTVPGGNAR